MCIKTFRHVCAKRVLFKRALTVRVQWVLWKGFRKGMIIKFLIDTLCMEQKIVMSGVLLRDGQALVVRRSMDKKFLPGSFEFPGGKVDFGEDAFTALSREFEEEVGFSVEVGEFIRTFSYVTGTRHTVELVFYVNGTGDVTLSSAHSEYARVNTSEGFERGDEIGKTLRMIFE